MKGFHFFATCCISLLFSACGKEEVSFSSATQEKGIQTEIVLQQEELGVKSHLEGMNVLWSPSDRLKIFSGNTSSEFTYQSTSNDGKGVFVGKLEPAPQYVALYPYSSEAILEEPAHLRTVLPTVQVAVQNSFAEAANLSVGVSSTASFQMKNICSLVKFDLKREDVVRIRFSGLGQEAIAGTISVNAQNPSEYSFIQPEQKIQLIPSEGQALVPGTYCIAVLPVNLSQGILMEYELENGQILRTRNSSPARLARNEILYLGNPEPGLVFSEGDKGSVDFTKVYRQVVFSAASGGECFRIPSMVQTQDGSLLVFCEDRHSSWQDKSFTDIVVKKSVDQGKTWTDKVGITSDSNNGGYAFMDPTPVADLETGKLFLFTCRWKKGDTDVSKNQAFLSVSEDQGTTWSAPERVDSKILLPGMFCAGFGPGHGLQIRTGKYKGRLVLACRQSNGQESVGTTLYSDDHGKTWQVGNKVKSGEMQLAEADEDLLYMNIRHGSKRRTCFSRNGGSSWSSSSFDERLPYVERGCHASVLGMGEGTLFYCGPQSGPVDSNHDNRYGLILKRSLNSASTWSEETMLYENAAGYSDLMMLEDGKMAVIFEAGPEKGFVNLSGVRPQGWMRLDLLVLPREVTHPGYSFTPGSLNESYHEEDYGSSWY